MGRVQHLTRLALGRSPFQDLDRSNVEASGRDDNATVTFDTDPTQVKTGYSQQYDVKGRPINPIAQTHNADMRKAQNEALALVGVVERDRDTRAELQAKRVRLRKSRSREDRDGKDLFLMSLSLDYIFTYYPETLMLRCLVGLYHPDVPFANILARDATRLGVGGFRNICAVLFPGLGWRLTHYGLQFGLFTVLEIIASVTAKVMEQRSATRVSKADSKPVGHVSKFTTRVVSSTVDILLSPLLCYSECARLGLTEVNNTQQQQQHTSLLRFCSTFFAAMWNHEPRHWYSWYSAPIIFLLAGSALRGAKLSVENGVSLDFGCLLVQPDISKIQYDGIYHRLHLTQVKVLRWCGWEAPDHEHPQSGQGVPASEQGLTHSGDNQRGRASQNTRHSSVAKDTSLTSLPALRLGALVTSAFERMLQIPLDCLILRLSAKTFVQLAGSSQHPLSNPIELPPSGVWLGGVLAAGKTPSASPARLGLDIARSMSKVGLALGLVLVVKSALYGITYALVRSHGISQYGWGGACEEGDGEEGR